MKRITLIAILLLLGSLSTFTSCKEKTQWMKFIGYTRNDIIGTYEATTDDAFYESLPTEGNYIFKNASATITPDTIVPNSATSISFHINFPNTLNKTFLGKAPLEANDYIIKLHAEDGYSLTSYVYHSDKGGIRLNGFVRIKTSPGDTLNNIRNYHFDLTKQ